MKSQQLDEEERQQQRKRKPRKDKGMVLMTPRDEYCLQWIADQYAVRLDQIQMLLSRWPQGKLKNEQVGLAPTTVKDQINRWQRAGWIEYQRILVGQPGWVWITKKGLQILDWDGIYTARAPAYTRLHHIFAVNLVRMAEEERKGFTWKSEREYRAELEGAEKGERLGPIPDALITSGKGGTIAVEVELTAKKPDELRRKLEALVGAYDGENRLKFPTIWFYVPDEKLKVAVKRAREDLIESDQKRVAVAVFPGLV